MGTGSWKRSEGGGESQKSGKRPQRDNSGVLFDNAQNKKTPNHPDLRGQCTISGQRYWVSAWSKTSKNGNDFLSLAFNPIEDRREGEDDEPPPRRTP
jgi:hypothetical protein